MNDEEISIEALLTDLDREAKVYAVLGDLTAGSVRKDRFKREQDFLDIEKLGNSRDMIAALTTDFWTMIPWHGRLFTSKKTSGAPLNVHRESVEGLRFSLI